MKQMEPKQKDAYEPPEVRDIAPVTIATVHGSRPDDDDDNNDF